MIEKIVYDYLTSLHLNVFMEDPEGTPTLPYYVIQKTGGGETEHIKRATLAIQSFGSSLYNTALANEALKTAMDGLINLDAVASVSLNSDYNFTDTTRRRYRYQAVFDIIHY